MISERPTSCLGAPLAVLAICTSLLVGAAAAQDARSLPEQQSEARVLWKYAPANSRFSEVVARDGTVFALDRSGVIHALDAASGKPRWTRKEKEPFSFGFGIALSEQPAFDALLVACDNGLFALEAKTGKKLWHADIPLGVAGPACTADAVFAGSADGSVYALELTTGRILWQHEYLEDAPEDPPGFPGHQARFPGRPARPRGAVTDGEMVVLSIFDQCRVLAVDAKTGKRLWDFATKGWLSGRPAIGPRNVIVGSQDQHFYAIDKEMGKLAWKLKTRARNAAPPAPTERFVYLGSCDASVYAVDQGRVSWEFATDHEEGRGAPMYSCPLVMGDVVYVAAMRGVIYALQRKTGKLLWSLRPLANSELNSDLATDGERLFVTTRKNGDAGQSAVLAIEAK